MSVLRHGPNPTPALWHGAQDAVDVITASVESALNSSTVSLPTVSIFGEARPANVRNRSEVSAVTISLSVSVVVNDVAAFDGNQVEQTIISENPSSVDLGALFLPYADGTVFFYNYNDGTGPSNWFQQLKTTYVSGSVLSGFSDTEGTIPTIQVAGELIPLNGLSQAFGAIPSIDVEYNLSPAFASFVSDSIGSRPLLSISSDDAFTVTPVRPLYDTETGFVQPAYPGATLSAVRIEVSSTDSGWLNDDVNIHLSAVLGGSLTSMSSVSYARRAVSFEQSGDIYGRWSGLQAELQNGNPVQWFLGGHVQVLGDPGSSEPTGLTTADIVIRNVVEIINFTLGVGTNGANDRGFSDGSFGTLAPTALYGKTVTNVVAQSDDTFYVATSDATVIDGHEKVKVTIEGFAGSIVATWTGTEYSAQPAGIFALLDSQVGSDVAITITAVKT